MDLNEFQAKAKLTDQFSAEREKILHPLLNLTESVAVLHRFIEQSHREKELPDAYAKSRLTQKIGDILWYVANIASRNSIDLSDAASENLTRANERWGRTKELKGKHFDDAAPVYERLPRRFRIAFFEPTPASAPRKLMIAVPSDANEWIQVGSN